MRIWRVAVYKLSGTERVNNHKVLNNNGSSSVHCKPVPLKILVRWPRGGGTMFCWMYNVLCRFHTRRSHCSRIWVMTPPQGWAVCNIDYFMFLLIYVIFASEWRFLIWFFLYTNMYKALYAQCFPELCEKQNPWAAIYITRRQPSCNLFMR